MAMFVSGSSTSTGSFGTLYTTDGANVGIGTTNPTARLHLYTADDYSQDFKISNDTVTMRMYASSANVFQFLQTTNNDMLFGTNDTERLRIEAGGTVGIGTNDPDGLVHIHSATAGSVSAHGDGNDLVVENSGDAGISILSPDASYSRILFGSPTDSIGARIFWSYAASKLTVGTNGSGYDLSLEAGSGDGNSNHIFIDGDTSNNLLKLTGNKISGSSSSTKIHNYFKKKMQVCSSIQMILIEW